ncbi:MAG: alpha/beta hydrolase [Planctomycetota bacterium]
MRASWNLLVLLAAFPTACIDLPRPEPLAGGQSEVAEATRLTAVGRVAALRSGPETGPRILYLHGTPGSSGNWLDYLRDPIGGFESFAIDRPGFGRSGDEVRLPLADQVAAAAPYLASGRPNVVVGHSLGAPIAAWLAASYPQHVDGLVLLGSSLDPELECIAWYQVGARGLEPVVPDILNKANDEVWDLDEELRLLQPMLQDIRCPVAIVHGTEDTLVPYANVDYMLEELVNAERVDVWTVEGGDHFVLWRDEDEPFVRQAIESVLPGTEVSEFPVFAADDPALDEWPFDATLAEPG